MLCAISFQVHDACMCSSDAMFFKSVSYLSFYFHHNNSFFLGPCHSCLLTEQWLMHCLRFVILPSTTNVGGMEHHLYSQVLYCPCLHLLPFLKDNFFIWQFDKIFIRVSGWKLVVGGGGREEGDGNYIGYFLRLFLCKF